MGWKDGGSNFGCACVRSPRVSKGLFPERPSLTVGLPTPLPFRVFPFNLPRLKILSTAKRMLRGDVSARTAALEATRRMRQFSMRRRERASLGQLDQQPALLREEFARIRASDLLAHFRSRVKPKFFPGFHDLKKTSALQQQLYSAETT